MLSYNGSIAFFSLSTAIFEETLNTFGKLFFTLWRRLRNIIKWQI